MRFSRNAARRPLEINMTPMIDVVFLLLIFFMTVSQVAEANREEMELSRVQGTAEPGRSENIVNIDREGTLRIAGEAVTPSTLSALCREESERSLGGDTGRLSVVLRVDRQAACGRVNETAVALRSIGVVRLRFAVTGLDEI